MSKWVPIGHYVRTIEARQCRESSLPLHTMSIQEWARAREGGGCLPSHASFLGKDPSSWVPSYVDNQKKRRPRG